MEKDQYIGITETSDPCFNLGLFDNLYKGNIIITKRITDKLIEKLVENKDKIILHCTCTGYGGTVVEPFVPTYNVLHDKVKQLIDAGFPVSHIVLRVDPVIPTEKGINLAKDVIHKFLPLGIKRVRWSSLDMYNHVKERFIEKGLKMPYETFHADKETIRKAHDSLKDVCDTYGSDLETCGEAGYGSTPCLSQKDIDILGLANEITLVGSKGQRKTCSCPENKKELIHNGKPHQCEHKCLYCYWKN